MRYTPFGFWTEMWTQGFALAETGMKFGEMVGASAQVVDSRTRTISDAARNPLAGDYRELGRMVPEKVEAFSQAGASAATDFFAIQNDAIENWRAMAVIATRGRPPSFAEVGALAARSARMATRASGAAGKALAPVHHQATANARRLAPKPRKR